VADNLDKLQALTAAGQQQMFLRGTVVLPTGATAFAVNINGNVLPASAADNVSVNVGDSVLVAVLSGATGQAEAIVLFRMSTTGLHPATGTVTVVPVGSQTITVKGADGQTYTAYFLAGYTPAVNDNVEMVFIGGYPYVSKAGTTPTPPPVQTVAPPPTAPNSGTTTFAAADASTYWGPGGWGSWAGGTRVFTGDIGNGPVTGAWFYAGGPTQLAGRTITGGRVTFGSRYAAGSYNSPVAVNIYTHSSPSRPGGNVALVNGPTVVTAQPYQGLTTYTLTQAQAQDLVNGGGIAISGGSYAGFDGIAQNAQSGTVSIDWSR
jgi:hypothetical protein